MMRYKNRRSRNNAFFDINNVLTTLKIVVVGIPIAIGAWIISMIVQNMAILGNVLMIAWFIITLFLWGWLANKWWGWK
jgi:hypothetical protein